jgi:hypothetical protein
LRYGIEKYIPSQHLHFPVTFPRLKGAGTTAWTALCKTGLWYTSKSQLIPMHKHADADRPSLSCLLEDLIISCISVHLWLIFKERI